MTATTEKPRIQLGTAQIIAESIRGLLGPFVERIKIAGSIRRCKPTVSDIELVAVPATERTATDLFGNAFAEVAGYNADEWIG